jgi:protein phosphatase
MNNTETYAKTDTGLWRQNNEDSYLVIDDDAKDFDIRGFGGMFAIADGMGGHAAGEVASKMACRGLLTYYTQQPKKGEDLSSPYYHLKNLEKVIHKTNREIFNHGKQHNECFGMGTTLSVLVLWEKYGLIGHVGDSRIYRQRDSSFEQLTVDQTKVQSLLEDGTITPDQAISHPYKHVLSQALGVSKHLDEVMIRCEAVKAGDIYLLSSDGLHDHVPEKDIRKTLTDHSAPSSICEALVKLALDYGGKDNITVVVVKVSERE